MQKLKYLFFASLIFAVTYSIFQQGELSYEVYLLLFTLALFSIFIPHWAIYLLIVLAPINLYLAAHPGNLLSSSKEYLYIIVLFFSFVRIILRKDLSQYFKTPLTTPMVVFTIFMLVQAFRNPVLGLGFNGFKFYIQHIPFFFFGIIFFRDKRKLYDLLLLTFIILIVVAILEVLKFQGHLEALWLNDETAVKIGHQTGSLAGGSFTTSMLCVLINCLSIGMIIGQRGLKKILLISLIVLAIIGIYLSHTRGAYLSLLFSFLTLIFLAGRRFRLFLPPLFLTVAMLVYVPTFSQRFFSTYDSSANLRWFFYSNGIKEIFGRGLWLFGSGLFTHDMVAIKSWQPGMPDPIFFDNHLLIIVAESGILALILLGTIFMRFIKKAKMILGQLHDNFLKGLCLGILTMWFTLFFAMVIGTATWLDVPLGMFFWLFSGVLFNLPQIEKQVIETPKKSIYR